MIDQIEDVDHHHRTGSQKRKWNSVEPPIHVKKDKVISSSYQTVYSQESIDEYLSMISSDIPNPPPPSYADESDSLDVYFTDEDEVPGTEET